MVLWIWSTNPATFKLVLNKLILFDSRPMVTIKDNVKKVVFMNIKELGEFHGAFYTSLLESVSGKQVKLFTQKLGISNKITGWRNANMLLKCPVGTILQKFGASFHPAIWCNLSNYKILYPFGMIIFNFDPSTLISKSK